MQLKGSQTEKNLLTAFAGESQARNRYTYYASEARKAGYEYIAAIFLETADNEKEHAKVFFKHLAEGRGRNCRSLPLPSGRHLEQLKSRGRRGKLRMDHHVSKFRRSGGKGRL